MRQSSAVRVRALCILALVSLSRVRQKENKTLIFVYRMEQKGRR